MSNYGGTFTEYPITFINAELSFSLELSHVVSPVNALAQKTYLRVCFRFDKGGTGNIQERTFCRFLADRSSFCPLLAALHTLDRWLSCDLYPLTPIFCYRNMKVVTFIHDSLVTKNLRNTNLQAYLNPHHLYNLHLKDVGTNSVRVIACLILVV